MRGRRSPVLVICRWCRLLLATPGRVGVGIVLLNFGVDHIWRHAGFDKCLSLLVEDPRFIVAESDALQVKREALKRFPVERRNIAIPGYFMLMPFWRPVSGSVENVLRYRDSCVAGVFSTLGACT